MPKKLRLVSETKIHKLLPDCDKRSRLEASGVVLTDPETCYVVFDNTPQVARINPALRPDSKNTRINTISPSDGFESIAWDAVAGRFFLLVEAIESSDGKHRGYVVECDRNFAFERCSRLDKVFHSGNKGFEGVAHHRDQDREYLWALCEGNLCCDQRKGGGRIQVFTRTAEQNWSWVEEIKLPDSAEFEDYSAIAIDGQRAAVVSQQSRRLWVGELDDARRGFRESGTVYRFPDESYCNVEGVDWLSPTRILMVSDRRKKKTQTKRCTDKHQSIHIFDIPSA